MQDKKEPGRIYWENHLRDEENFKRLDSGIVLAREVKGDICAFYQNAETFKKAQNNSLFEYTDRSDEQISKLHGNFSLDVFMKQFRNYRGDSEKYCLLYDMTTFYKDPFNAKELRIGQFPPEVTVKLMRHIKMDIEHSRLLGERAGIEGHCEWSPYLCPTPSGYLPHTIQLRQRDDGQYMVTIIKEKLFERINALAENETEAMRFFDYLTNRDPEHQHLEHVEQTYPKQTLTLAKILENEKRAA